jgi:chromate transport protein ChrA
MIFLFILKIYSEVLSMAIISNLIQLAIVILAIVGMWKTFEKAGQPGWAAIIPFYNLYIITLIIKKPAWWIILACIPFVHFVVAIEVAKKYGKSTAFGIFLLGIFYFIGYPIIGLTDAKYTG